MQGEREVDGALGCIAHQRGGFDAERLGDLAQHQQRRIAGTAFELARAAITQVKASRKYPTLTVFRSGRADFDETANLIYGLHDTLLQQITPKQWETIAMYLLKKRVDHTAKALSVDISTASRNLKRGYFWQLEDTSLIMGNIIRHTFL